MDLKELLGEELAKQVAEKLGDKKLILDTGSLVDTKSQDFAKEYVPRSTLKTKISELQEQYKQRDKEAKEALETQQRKHAIQIELIQQGYDAPELIAPLIDSSKLIDLGGGRYSGMKELIEPMKEKYNRAEEPTGSE